MKRIQGTDGIRGTTRLSISNDENPLKIYLEDNVLTESFFELYVYCYCQELLSSTLSDNHLVIIGWDPRDPTDKFNQAAILGARKAGFNVFSTGILPTPAITLYQLSTHAVCSFVLTASHNPSDQNGIKIFLAPRGLKLFPHDDECFTRKIHDVDYSMLSQLPLSGFFEDHHILARNLFIDYSTTSFNSWLTYSNFSNLTLIIDAANGAFSSLVEPIFGKFFHSTNLFYSNCSPDKGINVNSGVADLEGHHVITSDMIDPTSGTYTNYETIQLLFKKGRETKNNLSYRCIGIVFDGDGDRCFILIYNPQLDEIVILSGDKLLYLQSIFIKTHNSLNKALFVNTVESDLELSRNAQKCDFEVLQTAVGDKWILWQAVLQDWQVRKSFIAMHFPRLSDEIHNIDTHLYAMEKNLAFNALKISELFSQLDDVFLKCASNNQIQKLNDQLTTVGSSRFIIGGEESGHIITLGKLSNSNFCLPVYIGNGLKSALNSLASINTLSPIDPNCFFSWLCLYTDGYKKSWPIYYVNKSLLSPNSSFYKETKFFILHHLEIIFPEYQISYEFKPEEPEMIFFYIFEPQNQLAASIFVRNSGTEDKMSLCLRGKNSDKNHLDYLSKIIYKHILIHVKNHQTPFAQAEKKIIMQIASSAAGLFTKDIDLPHSINRDRLIKEMLKQKLIYFINNKWFLSDLGLFYHSCF
ncbi:hypothetical protein WDW89_02225 [Deltaproteobacteria bacterium TL4]